MISVLIPTYNCGKYIAGAIESVLGQTYKDTEIIVVDDGSTDDTSEVIKRFGSLVRYIRQKNQGASRARNTALEAARGDYIALLDADDRWKPFKLELQLAALRSLPDVDLVFTNYSTIDEDGALVEENCLERGFPIFEEYGVGLKDLFAHSMRLKGSVCEAPFPDGIDVYYGSAFDKLFMGNFILPSTELFRTKSMDIAPFFDETYRCANDQDFHLRFSKGHKVACIDHSTTEYRVNRNDHLSGKQNIPALILNTIATRRKIMSGDKAFAERNRALVDRVFATNYQRLAYFYLSELDTVKARTYSIESLKYKQASLKSWAIYFSSFSPRFFLNSLRGFKSTLSSRKNVSQNRTSAN